ncbi:hybrid nucleoside-diphosphate sugar epimerase/sugar transferase [Devosia beringensis]|uniref:hybrid nucleoside-diphosphate sugar epimerase/sugar transferase n=1 Tax=Devosia beringensis TaxID=2657486 RepID=UPI00186B8CD1|nr:hybrid nucleoside-diphosphate sugar epimerase/sugar transferase [Devosia beringensis]
MKIVITGASGFVGSMLVPLLAAGGTELVLAGRSPERLKSSYPGHICVSYESLPAHCYNADLLINLAVMNSDQAGEFADFEAVNVQFALQLARLAATAGIRRFVNVSSLHAIDPGHQHSYAATKRLAAEHLKAIDDVEVLNLYLPAIYGDRWAGRWQFINSLPAFVRPAISDVLRGLKPTLNVDRLAAFLRLAADGGVEAKDVILTDGQARNNFYSISKRTIDIAVFLGIAVLFWWLLLIIWIMVKAQSPGPGIFRQERIGRDGRPFVCYKFRTMEVGTRQAATHEVSGSSVTRLGHSLRRYKLDELPQILNLAKGDMSLVGPRPCLPVQAELIKARRSNGVLQITPGITGLSQVQGIDMSHPARLAQEDRKYLDLRCLPLDLKIAVRTIFGSGRGDRVIP